MTTPPSQIYTVAIAGSTEHTLMCVEALHADKRFEIVWVLTPEPKPQGRRHQLTPNPVHQFAEKHQIQSVLLKDKINEEIKTEIIKTKKIDFLLVVDFGYMIPEWLLELPGILPLNIHPSDLPRWRGSSPGQFVLLNGEKNSAISLIEVTAKLDAGPIFLQLPFTVNPTWTQHEYYHSSFSLMVAQLPQTLSNIAKNQLFPTPQPASSPTPLARRLSKTDGFIEWEIVSQVLKHHTPPTRPSSPLLQEQLATGQTWPELILHACRALQPWPTLWTFLPTPDGQKRMQIMSASLDEKKQLVLETVKIEGQREKNYSDFGLR